MQRESDRRSSRVLFAIAIAAAVVGVVLEWTGGFNIRLYGVRISAHGALRPILVALLAGAWGFRLLDDADQESLIADGRRISRRLVPIGIAAVAAALVAAGVAYGTRAAGGSDPYGYISQSKLWRAGDLRVHQEFVAAVPWPNADWSFTPLGYRPSENHTLVPTYAPGLPLIMALFTGMAGSCGPYLVTPICGALLVLLTYAIGALVSGRAVGAAAALCVASSPTIVFMTLWPMSDVPAAMCWTASLLLACWTFTARGSGGMPTAAAAAAGAAAGVAIAIRPNLVPLAIFPAALVAWPLARTAPWMALRRTAAFGIACMPFVLFIAWLYNNLYGSPFQSGYGDSASIFQWEYLRGNLARYPRWLWDTQGPLVFLFPLAAWLPAGPAPVTRALRRFLLAFIAGVLACYLWYRPFDAWWFLRFLLPAAAPVLVLAADVVWHGSRRFGLRTQVLALAAFTIVTVNYGTTRMRELGALDIGNGEQKYADVGRYVASRLPANAVVITMQHSGSVRYYSGRRTLRYDVLEADWLDRAIAHLRTSGYEPYLLLEKWELPLFRERFAAERSVAILDGTPMAQHVAREVFLYRTDDINSRGEPDPIPATSGCQ